RGALAAGAAPTLLPGGRPVTDAAARAELESAWGLAEGGIPAEIGRSTDEMLAAAAGGELAGLLVGGVDPYDLADPELGLRALDEVRFLVSLELRPSAVTERADVVLPVAAAVHRAGSYLNWEGRVREFTTVIEATGQLPDCRVLDTLAVEMDADLYTQTPAAAAGELARLGTVTPAPGHATGSARQDLPQHGEFTVAAPEPGQARLATWRSLLDNGSLQDEEPHLTGTARPAMALLGPATAAGLGIAVGDAVTVGTDRGELTVPAGLADLPDGVVWLPTNSGPSTVRRTLGVGHGALVGVRASVTEAPADIEAGEL
ncbi:MAG TPA: molybdopterin dinucleotide binding domain-containing protein, partial [Pseudonocardiaceae bacterium]